MKKICTIFSLLYTLTFTQVISDNSTNIYIEKSNNGVMIVNISSPTKKGISYSSFSHFNIDDKGLVLNNSNTIARSALAGIINPNKNIDTPARLAVLRFSSNNTSNLKGTLEAVSKNSLDVIISNKNGITLDGVNFYNINNITLTTADVKLVNDDIDNIYVYNGKILSLKELNASNTNKINILSNLVKIEKDIIANKLEIATGNNVYNINGENVEIVKTLDGEIGTPISSDIIGSIYSNDVRIIATKSGIGINSITSDNIDVSINSDFVNSEKIKANKNLKISANNIVNDNKLLISDNISLIAKDSIYNINGALIYATNNLSIFANQLENIGKVLSYGEYEKAWISANGTNFTKDNIDKWEITKKDKHKSFRFFRWSETESEKEKAVKKFYNTTLKSDEYSYLFDKYIEEYKKNHISTLSLDNDYSGSYTKIEDENNIKTLKAYIVSKNKKTDFSIISADNIDINIQNNFDNKDAKIIANNKNYITSNIFNNSSSISDEKVLLQDGRETLLYSGDRTCWFIGLSICVIDHSVKYERKLLEGRNVYIKAHPSKLVGKDIKIVANEVNFKSYDEDETKSSIREENEIINMKK